MRPLTSIVPDRASYHPVHAGAEPLATLLSKAQPLALTGKRLLAAQAMRLLVRLDSELLKSALNGTRIGSAESCTVDQKLLRVCEDAGEEYSRGPLSLWVAFIGAITQISPDISNKKNEADINLSTF
jgi:hypothetical protein